jgi:diamine N-acetyltransferase
MHQASSQLVIRRAASADAPALATFAARAFEDTFAKDNTREDMQSYLAKAFGEPQQLREIEDPGGITLLAEDADRLIGFAQIRREPVPGSASDAVAVELRRFYIARAFHGQGLAQVLMHAAEHAASTLGARTLWLGVWERNLRAIAFYTKCGFVDVGSQEFVLGSDRQTDRVMTKAIHPADQRAGVSTS